MSRCLGGDPIAFREAEARLATSPPGEQQVDTGEAVDVVRWVGDHTLQGTWRATVGVTFGMLLLVVTVAAVAIGHQHATFEDTTSALNDGTAAFVDLELALLELTDPIVTTVYRTGNAAAVAAARAEVSRAQAQVDLAFDEDRLVLELTEATAMTCTGTGLDTLTELRGRGIHIALDDFGTGFSSLSYLNDLPADILKVDRSFITGHKPNSASMLDSIITLAQRLGKTVVVEGIETPDELERTSAYHDLYGQGFLFHRPMLGAELLSLVARGSQERAPSRR